MPSGSAWMNDLRVREDLADTVLDGVGNLVRTQQRERAVHLDMDLNERIDARAPGPEVVAIQHVRMLQHDLPDARTVLLRELMIHQLLDGAPPDLRTAAWMMTPAITIAMIGSASPQPRVSASASAAITPMFVRMSEA